MDNLKEIKKRITAALMKNDYIKTFRTVEYYSPQKRQYPLERPVLCVAVKKVLGRKNAFAQSLNKKLDITFTLSVYFPAGEDMPIGTFEYICEALFAAPELGVSSIELAGIGFDKVLGARVLTCDAVLSILTD